MAETLAQIVRKKYPGAYDDIPDDELEARIDKKYPGAYGDMPRSTARQPSGPALAGRSSELRNAPKRSWWEPGWQAVREAVVGHPDRADAKAAGAGLTPTLAELGEAALAGASFATGSGAGAGLTAMGLKRAGAWAMRHPRISGAVVDAAPELARGDVTGAAEDALKGAAFGHVLGSAGRRVARRFGRGRPPTPPPAAPTPPATKPSTVATVIPAATGALPADLAKALRRAGVPAADIAKLTPKEAVEKLRRLPQPGNVTMPGTLPNVAKQPPGTISTQSAALIDKQRALIGDQIDNPLIDPAARAALAAGKVDRGRAVVEAHAKRVALAKKATAGTPFKSDSNGDQKVWMSLDDEGNPLEVITEHQAGALTRKGKPTTWVKRLWQ